MATYDAKNLIGTTFYGNTDVPIVRYAGGETVYTAKQGSVIGVLDTWLIRPEGLYWGFLDPNKRPYYALHKTGRFSVKALQEQGVLTVLETIKAEQKANETFMDKLPKWLLIGGLLFVAATWGKTYIQKVA